MRRAIRVGGVSLWFVAIALVCIGLTFSSCDNDVEIPDGAFDEKIVDLSGEWAVAAVSLNGVDITDRMEFGRLNLSLSLDANGPSSYSIENDGIPFIVTTNGQWAFDDNVYPREIVFNSAEGSEMGVFDTPPISRGDNFAIRFSLGCEDNAYVYQMKRQ